MTHQLTRLRALRHRIDEAILAEQHHIRRLERAAALIPAIARGPEAIVLEVASDYGIETAVITGTTQTTTATDARSIVAWIAKNQHIDHTTTARLLGRTPGALWHYHSRVNNSPRLQSRANRILATLTGTEQTA